MASFRFVERMLPGDGSASRFQIYVPPNFADDRPWPVVLFLHGRGEGGSDGRLQTSVGLGPAIRRHPERFPVVAVFPQAARGHDWRGPMTDRAVAVLERAMEEFPGDRRRVYVTGISMGGYGTWRLALKQPQRYAALAPICGGLDTPWRPARALSKEEVAAPPEPYAKAAERLKHLPAWIFHGDEDDINPVTESRVMVRALQAVGGKVRYTEYPRVGHNSWDRAYDEEEFMPWLLSHQLTS